MVGTITQNLVSRTGWTIEISSLEDLYGALRTAPHDDYGDDGIDWTGLPTFGGAEPNNTSGVWSWDETRLMVGTCLDDLKIIDRVDHEGEIGREL